MIRQIYQQMRSKILEGELKEGERLPSTRWLASELDVSRNVVLEAYELLHAEGFIETRRGAGTFVASGTYLKKQEGKTDDFPFHFLEPEENSDVIDFRSGIPALDLFPRKKWWQITREVLTNTSDSAFGYHHPEGQPDLRNVLSHYLLRTRGVQCHPDQIVITSGATQALSLTAQLLTSPGDTIMLEDPVTHDIQTIFKEPGATLHPIPVDGQGMMTELIPKDAKPRYVFVTPSHQFPLGGTLPIQRRIQLIEFARKSGCYIVEDDYDSEFRFEGPPISSIQGLEPERVVYIGSFSKILSPALRIGYLVLPPNQVMKCRELKWFSDLHTPALDQIILATFIEKGHLDKHIHRMKKLYKKRRECLVSCLNKYFSQKTKILGSKAGLHLVVEFNDIPFTETLINHLSRHGVRGFPVESHAIQKGRHRHRLILGYGNLSTAEIEEGVRRMKQCLYNKDQ